MTSHTFTVFGVPAPQGSKRHVGNGILVESSEKVKPWREAVKWAAYQAGIPPLSAAVEVQLTFYLQRPRGHYGTGRNVKVLKPSAPLYPAVRPDLDKLGRSTLDGLTDSGVIGDDSRVIALELTKWYGRPRCEVTIREVGP